MPLAAIACPQCGGALPKKARWTAVVCPWCAASVTLAGAADRVARAPFRDALARAADRDAAGGRSVALDGARWRLLERLGSGEVADAWLARRAGHPAAGNAVVKLARSDDAAAARALAAEHATLVALQQAGAAGAAWFVRQLPQPVAAGLAALEGGERRGALVVRHAPGTWGTLADVLRLAGAPVDPRHAVWIWRRTLDTLDWLHRAGWTHGAVEPAHLLVQPAEHAVRAIGWSRAAPGTAAGRARDLAQAAWTVRALLAPRGAAVDATPPIAAAVPRPLATLLAEATGGGDAGPARDAAGWRDAIGRAAEAAFGAPRFVPFDPLHPERT